MDAQSHRVFTGGWLKTKAGRDKEVTKAKHRKRGSGQEGGPHKEKREDTEEQETKGR